MYSSKNISNIISSFFFENDRFVFLNNLRNKAGEKKKIDEIEKEDSKNFIVDSDDENEGYLDDSDDSFESKDLDELDELNKSIDDDDINETLSCDKCDVYEHSLYFSSLRMISLFQSIVEKLYFMKSNRCIKDSNMALEDIFDWMKKLDYIESDDELNYVTLMVVFLQETTNVSEVEEFFCYSNDLELNPLVSPDTVVLCVESMVSIVNKIKSDL
jgi:hypothetical protein